MNNAEEILKSIQIGLNVAIFLRNTDRGLRATDLFSECAILLQILGNEFHSLGEYQKAKEYHEKALVIAKEIGDRDEKEQHTGTSDLYIIPLANIRRLKNITRKHLPSR